MDKNATGKTRTASMLSFSIIIEADNVNSTSFGTLQRCLNSLAKQPIEHADAVILMESGQLSQQELNILQQGYKWLRVKSLPPGASYAQLKSDSAALVTSDVLVICDCDVEYQPLWLEQLLLPFQQREKAALVAGETRTAVNGPYSLAIALTYIFPPFSEDTEPQPTNGYWANNFALRRDVLEKMPVPDFQGLFRGQNIVHSMAASKAGLQLWRAPQARAIHTLPSASYFLKRYFLLGRDHIQIKRLTQSTGGGIYNGVIPPDLSAGGRLRKTAHRMRLIARQQTLMLGWLPMALPVMLLTMTAYLIGLVVGYLKPAPKSSGRSYPPTLRNQ